MKTNKQKEIYKYQVLNSWDMTTAIDENALKEYDTYEHAVEVANKFAKQERGLPVYVAKVLYKTSAKIQDVELETETYE